MSNRKHFFSLITVFIAALSHAADQPRPIIGDETTSSVAASVSPDSGVSGEYGTWTVICTVGDREIREGGSLRVQLPDAWHAGPRNSAIRLQATKPEQDHYVSAHTERSDVKLKTVVEDETDDLLVKHHKHSLDGRLERYVFVVRVQVIQGSLQEGDQISIVYGDRSQGSAGMRAGVVTTDPLPILIAADFDGSENYRLLSESPELTLRPGAAVEMMIHAPSQGVAGQSATYLVALVDKEANPIKHSATVELTLKTGAAEFPREVHIPSGKGYAEFQITPTSTEPLRIVGRSVADELQATSNPMRVTETEPEFKIYWGDLHSHTHYSWDGVGQDQFDYARYTSGLDFYAMTDHAIRPTGEYTRGLSDIYWQEYTALTEQYNDPPRFVTLHAYECSLGTPYGHHNVFFRNEPGALVPNNGATLQTLWQELSEGKALTIPHHTGKFPGKVDFSVQNDELRRNFEIYSGHGLSEEYDPDHPLAFEQSLFTSDARSVNTPSFAQDAWMTGLLFSTISSSDDHRARPGQPHYGLAAIYAPELSREAIFQNLYDRYTYGTTGAKIILNFTLNGQMMGNTVQTDNPPLLQIKALGTDLIDFVELLRYQKGQNKFDVIQRWQPEALDFSAAYTDSDHQPGAVYYVRLMQRNQIRGRAVMAWSTPIWTLE